MKKTGMLLLMLLLSAGAYAQQTDASPSAGSGDADTPQGTVPTTVSFPIERVQTPTYADLYCAGFVSKQLCRTPISSPAGCRRRTPPSL